MTVLFEVVHTVWDWYDGPRRGIADCRGLPHVFESQCRDTEESPDTYLLAQIDPTTFALAIEDWLIWRRWESAFHRGDVSRDSHPALPEDRLRHEEIERCLTGRLVIDQASALRKRGEFQIRDDPNWSGYGWRPMEVRWYDPV